MLFLKENIFFPKLTFDDKEGRFPSLLIRCQTLRFSCDRSRVSRSHMKTQTAPAFPNPETQLPLFKMEKYFSEALHFPTTKEAMLKKITAISLK